MNIISSEQYAYYQRVNAAKERRAAFKKEQKERAFKEYARRNAEKLRSRIVWYKAAGEKAQRVKLKDGGVSIRRLLGSFERISLKDGLNVLHNPHAKEFGFAENCVVSGVEVYGPLILCDTLGWELIDCKLTRDDVERYFC